MLGLSSVTKVLVPSSDLTMCGVLRSFLDVRTGGGSDFYCFVIFVSLSSLCVRGFGFDLGVTRYKVRQVVRSSEVHCPRVFEFSFCLYAVEGEGCGGKRTFRMVGCLYFVLIFKFVLIYVHGLVCLRSPSVFERFAFVAFGERLSWGACMFRQNLHIFASIVSRVVGRGNLVVVGKGLECRTLAAASSESSDERIRDLRSHAEDIVCSVFSFRSIREWIVGRSLQFLQFSHNDCP